MIPGTRVPDNPIHRASLWLEELKYGARRDDNPGVEPMEREIFEELIRQCELRGLTPEEIGEAADYYGRNMAAMTLGQVKVMVSTPGRDGVGLMPLSVAFISAWLDGFLHGVATRAGKSGLSNLEIRRSGGRSA